VDLKLTRGHAGQEWSPPAPAPAWGLVLPLGKKMNDRIILSIMFALLIGIVLSGIILQHLISRFDVWLSKKLKHLFPRKHNTSNPFQQEEREQWQAMPSVIYETEELSPADLTKIRLRLMVAGPDPERNMQHCLYLREVSKGWHDPPEEKKRQKTRNEAPFTGIG